MKELKFGDIGETYEAVGLELNEETVVPCKLCKQRLAIFKRTLLEAKNMKAVVTCCYCGGQSEIIESAFPGTHIAGYFIEGATPEDVIPKTRLELKEYDCGREYDILFETFKE